MNTYIFTIILSVMKTIKVDGVILLCSNKTPLFHWMKLMRNTQVSAPNVYKSCSQSNSDIFRLFLPTCGPLITGPFDVQQLVLLVSFEE
jgi:hypothetical protein